MLLVTALSHPQWGDPGQTKDEIRVAIAILDYSQTIPKGLLCGPQAIRASAECLFITQVVFATLARQWAMC